MDEKDLINKTIEKIDIDGYGIEIRFSDGTEFVYNASDAGYSTWDIFNRVTNAIAMLKEHEAKTPVECEHNGYWYYTCPTCGNHEELFREWNYCPFCGQEVKWE